MREPDELVILGRISGLYGVRGWVKIFSHTEPRERIVDYDPWYLRQEGEWREVRVAEGRRHGKSVIARLEGIDERDGAARLLEAEIAVRRDQLDRLAEGEYYWADLEGLGVVTREGVELGVVSHLFETGANDVLVVRGERERLLPYTDEVVLEVDLERNTLVVDWDPDF